MQACARTSNTVTLCAYCHTALQYVTNLVVHKPETALKFLGNGRYALLWGPARPWSRVKPIELGLGRRCTEREINQPVDARYSAKPVELVPAYSVFRMTSGILFITQIGQEVIQFVFGIYDPFVEVFAGVRIF
jgi:hypothetical protein